MNRAKRVQPLNKAEGDIQGARQIDPHPVRVLVFPDFLLLDATGPVQVFSTGNDESFDRGGGTPYTIELVSLAGGPVRLSSGIVVMTASLPPVEALRQSTLIVAGGAGIGRALAERVLVDWVAKAHGVVRRCASVCTGAFLLAEAGILRQKRAPRTGRTQTPCAGYIPMYWWTTTQSASKTGRCIPRRESRPALIFASLSSKKTLAGLSP